MSEWDSDQKPGWGSPETTQSQPEKAPESGRDWKLIEKLVMSLQSEQRKSRRWGIFFKLLTFIYLFALLLMIQFPFGSSFEAATAEHTAIIEINGPIASDKEASADNVVGALREAFQNENSKAVLLRINSPGGSPVQSGYVYDEVKRLRSEYPDKKLYAVIADIGASGAYYIAAAADEIYADKASLVGSIGVVAGGFGFTGVMDKLGVERRLYTAGENKAFLDPFSPERQDEVAFWNEVLETTHAQFIEQVKRGRGDRLADDERLFSGLIWTGEQALDLGLIDGLGSSSYVAREIVGFKDLVDYSRQASPFKELIDRFGVAVGSGVFGQLVESRLELR
ncbi:S49 family peptidase [Marinobacter caseinilyticus]|uniref:S49 family peptidase n=1 Tax=Marinobacter caseinilyticus TaxID=2692195 RepID=UPI00140C037C|nr:S49 family peptidase [Marinobacter caseinilyticus]